MPKFTLEHYAAVVSTIALLASGGSYYVAKGAYDLSLSKDARELQEKQPAVDVQLTPVGGKSARFKIIIMNRGDINIVPQDITVLHSLEEGELYLSRAGGELLDTHLSLQPLGIIPPKGTATMTATVSGVTDGKADFAEGAELQFVVRLRLSDQDETLKTISVPRRVRVR